MRALMTAPWARRSMSGRPMVILYTGPFCSPACPDDRRHRAPVHARSRRSRRGGRGRARTRRRVVDDPDGRPHPAREVLGAAHAVHVHVEDARLFPEEVIVQRGDVEAVVEESGHHGVHLVLGEDEVAHEDVRAARPFREGDPPSETEGRRRGPAGDGDVQVAARDVHLQDAVLEVALLAQRGEDGMVVGRDVLGDHAAAGQDGRGEREDGDGLPSECHRSLSQVLSGTTARRRAPPSIRSNVPRSSRRLIAHAARPARPTGVEVLRGPAAGRPRAGRSPGGPSSSCAACCRRRSPSPWARSSARCSAASAWPGRSPSWAWSSSCCRCSRPIHQAVSANLGSRVAAWLYDRLTEACVRPAGHGPPRGSEAHRRPHRGPRLRPRA